jgi:hypothetical protein
MIGTNEFKMGIFFNEIQKKSTEKSFWSVIFKADAWPPDTEGKRNVAQAPVKHRR